MLSKINGFMNFPDYSTGAFALELVNGKIWNKEMNVIPQSLHGKKDLKPLGCTQISDTSRNPAAIKQLYSQHNLPTKAAKIKFSAILEVTCHVTNRS